MHLPLTPTPLAGNLTETWGEITARGLGNVLTELSHVRVRATIKRTDLMGEISQTESWEDIPKTECLGTYV